MADALTGNVDEVLTVGVRFLEAWQRAGSPAGSYLGPAVAGVAMIHGLRGDHGARHEWSAVLSRLGTPTGHSYSYGAVFDAMVMLHHGQASQAVERMAPEAAEVWKWVTWIWLHWYVALRAEATMLAGNPDAGDRLANARTIVAGNPVASAIVDRAQALLDNDQERLLATTDAFDAAGCRYQSARTLVLAGGDHAARGAAALADLGFAPMAPPWAPRDDLTRVSPDRRTGQPVTDHDRYPYAPHAGTRTSRRRHAHQTTEQPVGPVPAGPATADRGRAGGLRRVPGHQVRRAGRSGSGCRRCRRTRRW